MTQKELMSLFSVVGSVENSDMFLLYSPATGTTAKITAEILGAYLRKGIEIGISDSGTLVVGGIDTGKKIECVVPQMRSNGIGIDVSYDNGNTWQSLMTYESVGLNSALFQNQITTLQEQMNSKASSADVTAVVSEAVKGKYGYLRWVLNESKSMYCLQAFDCSDDAETYDSDPKDNAGLLRQNLLLPLSALHDSSDSSPVGSAVYDGSNLYLSPSYTATTHYTEENIKPGASLNAVIAELVAGINQANDCGSDALDVTALFETTNAHMDIPIEVLSKKNLYVSYGELCTPVHCLNYGYNRMGLYHIDEIITSANGTAMMTITIVPLQLTSNGVMSLASVSAVIGGDENTGSEGFNPDFRIGDEEVNTRYVFTEEGLFSSSSTRNYMSGLRPVAEPDMNGAEQRMPYDYFSMPVYRKGILLPELEGEGKYCLNLKDVLGYTHAAILNFDGTCLNDGDIDVEIQKGKAVDFHKGIPMCTEITLLSDNISKVKGVLMITYAVAGDKYSEIYY